MTKVIIISAPSGTGKGTIIARLMAEHPELRLRFSISATSRPPRGVEEHGREYYFFSQRSFVAISKLEISLSTRKCIKTVTTVLCAVRLSVSAMSKVMSSLRSIMSEGSISNVFMALML